MIDRHLAHLWCQMKIHRITILTHVCLHQIGCLCYCYYAKTSSSAVQKRHSKVYGNLIAPFLYSILLVHNYMVRRTASVVSPFYSILLLFHTPSIPYSFYSILLDKRILSLYSSYHLLIICCDLVQSKNIENKTLFLK